MKKKPVARKTVMPVVKSTGMGILHDIRKLIESARGRVATYANAEMTMLYWKVGERV